MIIFCYMLLLLLAGLGFRAYSMVGGTYNISGPFIAEDIFSLALLYFGMIGLWGYGRNKRYFGQRLWQVYFVVTLATIPVMPLISPKYQEVATQHGTQTMWGAYAFSTLLALPALWGWFSYAFRKKQLWVGA